MNKVDYIASNLLFGFLSIVIILSPWMFGSWETWWFWPFMACLFGAGICFAIRLMLSAFLGTRRLNLSRSTYQVIVLWAPFLIYALIRAMQAEVRMDAERSLLLHSSALLLGIMICMGISDTARTLLLKLMLTNFIMLSVYGIANYYIAGNSHVLWILGFPQYQEGYSRATGSYFCPDHYSGLMEIGLAASLALIVANKSPALWRLAGAGVTAGCLWAIFLSRSRGGGIVSAILICLALWLGTSSWTPASRRRIRGLGTIILALGITALIITGGHYVDRFKNYPWNRLKSSDRYLMSAAALRGWQSAPWFGIGPGMHQNLWPHFAPSSDGDRQTGRWPTLTNNHFHSYEAHDDWAQLLEEYGLVGMTLFLLAVGNAAYCLYKKWRRWSSIRPESTCPTANNHEWLLLGVLLSGLAMTIHSIGDFNMQIPATTWQLGALAGLAFATVRFKGAHS